MSQSTPQQCPQCGAPLSADAPAGLCPRCVMALNFGPDTAMTGDASRRTCDPLPVEAIAPHFPELEIQGCLGRGGMGVVYKARQKSLGRLVALKVLAPERERDPQFAQRFAREAQALAALNHPHIVTVHDFGERDGFFYLLMEYVDGVNLRELLRSRKLSPEEALAIVPPICEALQFAHERGIVHCDIKPENLLLDQAGRVKIADFGIARMVGTTAAEEQAVGTPGYMAPEQKTPQQQVDSRADIYALGVVFYEMLTGDLPGEKFQIPSRKVQVDVRLDEIVLRALERSPELRFPTAADLRTQVEAVVNEPRASSPADRPDAPRITRTGVSLAATWAYAALAFILLLEVLNVLRLSGVGLLSALVLAFIAAIIGAIPLAARLMQRQQQSDHQSASPLWLNISAAAATVLSLPAIAFSVFFVFSMLGESGGWHPGLSEAVVVSAALLASFLLPAAAWHLWRTASPRTGVASGGSRPWLKLALVLLLLPIGAFLVASSAWFATSKDPSPKPAPIVGGMPGISAIHAQGHAVYMVQEGDRLDYALYYPGRFDLSQSTTRSTTRPNGTWTEEGGLTLASGRSFGFQHNYETPDTLTINGRSYKLKDGRLFILKDDGSVEQKVARPGRITVENLPELARPFPDPIAWKPFAESTLKAALASGQPVFVAFTADWCVNCKVYEQQVLETEPIQAAFRQKNVLALKADFSRRDPAIQKVLAGFDRSDVPLYVLYRPNEPTPFVADVVTKEGLLQELARLPSPRGATMEGGEASSLQAMELAAARENLDQARKRFEVGLATHLAVAEAEYQLTLAESARSGDALAGPRALVALAKERLKVATLRHESGTGTSDEFAAAKLELARAEAELQRVESAGGRGVAGNE